MGYEHSREKYGALTYLNVNCFEGIIAMVGIEVIQEIKNKDTIYCVLIHNKYNLLKFSLKAHTVSQQSIQGEQQKVNKRNENDRKQFKMR